MAAPAERDPPHRLVMLPRVSSTPARNGISREPADSAADVLGQPHPAELLETSGWILERAQDRFPLPDREADDLDAEPVGVLEAAGEYGVVDEARQLDRELVADGDACELHPVEDTGEEPRDGNGPGGSSLRSKMRVEIVL